MPIAILKKAADIKVEAKRKNSTIGEKEGKCQKK